MKAGIVGETSGRVRDAFIARGHDAVSCDILPSDKPGPHRHGDARSFDWQGFDIIICHPPCTYLCNSGVRWIHTQPERHNQMIYACEFFNWCLALPCDRVAVENPIPHKHAKALIGEYTQIIQPWMFGHGETKATCLWLRGLPKLEPTNIVSGREARIHRLPPSPDRWKKRSETYQGIADAMAVQWGGLMEVTPA